MTLKIKVSDAYFQYQPRGSHDACLAILAKICDELSYGQGKVHGRTDGWADGQSQATTITLPAESQRVKAFWVALVLRWWKGGKISDLRLIKTSGHAHDYLIKQFELIWKSYFAGFTLHILYNSGIKNEAKIFAFSVFYDNMFNMCGMKLLNHLQPLKFGYGEVFLTLLPYGKFMFFK